jgi:hypothetical protein
MKSKNMAKETDIPQQKAVSLSINSVGQRPTINSVGQRPTEQTQSN